MLSRNSGEASVQRNAETKVGSLQHHIVCSTSPSGGNQVDGLPPAPSGRFRAEFDADLGSNSLVLEPPATSFGCFTDAGSGSAGAPKG